MSTKIKKGVKGSGFRNAGDLHKTSFCPKCTWSYQGDPRTVNDKKIRHIKYCTLIVDETERESYLKHRSLTELTPTGITRKDYEKPTDKSMLIDTKKDVQKEIFAAYNFLRAIEKISFDEKKI